MSVHPSLLSTCAALILCAALPAEDRLPPAATLDQNRTELMGVPAPPAASRHGRTIPAIGGGQGKTVPGGVGGQIPDAQELLKQMQKTMPLHGAPGAGGGIPDAQELLKQAQKSLPRHGGPGAMPAPGTSTHSSHCTATINGKTVYDGPGSSISVKAKDDGNGKPENEVVVDGQRR